ncbi:MAG: gliding motility-associated C-terminal domain-containing protein [Prolixibacteraceae bacterium]
MKYILSLLFLIVASLANGQPYAIDSVCVNSTRVYRVNGEPASTYEWILTDQSNGNPVVLPNPAGDPFTDIDPISNAAIEGNSVSIFWPNTGNFSLMVVQTSAFGCDSTQMGLIRVYGQPTAFAGAPQIVCNGNTINLTDATASNYRLLRWTTSGDGVFNDNNSLNPVYTPGPNDLLTANVSLLLTAHGLGASTSCPPAMSKVEITIIHLEANVVKTDITCFGADDGRIQISGTTGGSGNYEYRLNGLAWTSSPDFNNLEPGSYEVWVRDTNFAFCETSLGTYEIVEPDQLAAVVKFTDETCLGNDGTISALNPTGGWGNYEFALNDTNWQTEGKFTGLSAGSYDVWIADADFPGCKIKLETVVITKPEPLSATISKTDVTCFAGNDGTITVSDPKNGSGIYEYSLDGIDWQLDSIFADLSAGSYTVLMRDANAPECTATLDTITLTEPERLQASTSFTNVSCFGANDGTIRITGAKGGLGTYEFTVDGINWTSSETFINLKPDTYYVLMRDLKGKDCIEFIQPEITITEPLQMQATVTPTDLSCHGANDGSILISNATNGFPPYQFSIDNGASWNSNNSYTALLPGTYVVKMRDSKNCEEDLGTYTIVEPDPLYADVASTNATCLGNDGTITISNPQNSVSGLYEYNIDGANWTSNGAYTDLVPGTYVVKIRDANLFSCELTLDTISIKVPVPLSATGGKTDVTCYAAKDGTIGVINPSGGSGLYEYSIDGSTWIKNLTFSGLTPGSYTLEMRDANSNECMFTIGVFEITEPDQLIATIATADVSCWGGNDGKILFSNMSGGSGAWEFSYDGMNWYAGDILSLTAGNYNIQMRDAANPLCVVSFLPVEIYQPPKLTATVNPTNVTCYGGNDGTISITSPQNGVGPYQFSIDGGATWHSGNTFTGLSANTYNFLIVQDANSCVATLDGVEILQPERLEATEQHTNETLPGANNGTITIVGQHGGTGLYKYSLDGVNWQFQSIFTDLSPGSYVVSMADANVANCFITIPVIILPAGTITAGYTKSDVTCNDGSDGTITFLNATGVAVFEFSINGGVSWQNSNYFPGLIAQEYTLVIRDAGNTANSIVLGTIEIKQPDVIDATIAVTNETFPGAADGKITITNITGGSGVYQFSIDGVTWLGTSVFSGLTSGVYDVTIRDKNAPDCLITFQKVINPAGSIQADVDHTDVKCKGDNSGIISISHESGASSYNYSVDGGATWKPTRIIAGLTAGTYDVMIRDAANPANQVLLGKVVITEPPLALTVGYFGYEPPVCYNGTGKLIVTASGGTPPYTNTGTYTIPAGKKQTITVIDKNGCTANLTFTMPNLLPVLATSVAVSAKCFGEDGTITITATGGTKPYYLNGKKLDNNGQITVNSPTGMPYSFIVRDSNGCQSNVISGTLAGPPELIMQLSPIEPLCSGSVNNTVLVTATGGTPPYTGTGSFVLPTGIHTLTVTDALGCSISGTIDITLKDPPPAPIGDVIQPNCIVRTGTIVVNSPTGPNYAYSLDAGAYQPDTVWTGLAPGSTHTMRVKDISSGCESELATFAIDLIPEPAQTPLYVVTQPGCLVTSGAIEITDPAAGTGYQYSFDNGTYQDLAILSNLLPGSTHTIKVKDISTGCESIEQTIRINELPADPQVPVAKVTAVPTCNDLNGTVEITSPLGAEFEYNVNGGAYQSSVVFANLKTGTYSIGVRSTITGCESIGTIAVPAVPPPPIMSFAGKADSKCFGEPGSISLSFQNVPDGTYVIKYQGGQFDNVLVTGNQTTFAANAGTYNILTIDANGCTSGELVNVTINQPSEIVITTDSITEIDLKSQRKGEIDISISGGNGPYNIKWSNGETTEDIKNLSDGSYTVFVTDASGCVNSKVITIPPPNYPPVAVDDEFSSSCYITTGNIIVNDSDPEGDPFYIEVVPVVNPLHGTVTINPDGSFEYHVEPNYEGVDSFEYAIFDAKHYQGDTAKVVITILADFDHDGIVNSLDPDADGDGILNVDEGGILADADGDGRPNYLDIDSDNDGIVDNFEGQKSPPDYIAPSFKDTDGDGLDDAYDSDQNGKKIVPVDTDMNLYNPDGIPDFLDVDSDNDEVTDYIEGHDANANGKPDYVLIGKDEDADGLDDGFDTVINICAPSDNAIGSNAAMQDFDGDGLRDWRDENDDNDEYLTRFEDLNMDGDFSNDDTDFDGHPEYLDYGRDCDLMIPNAFSPNEDNIHDYFQIFCIDHFPNAKMYIFDQQGNKLFEKDHYGNLEFWGTAERAWWDGRTTNRAADTLNGKVIPGTYYYVLQLGNGEVKKSFVFVSY